MFHTHLCRTIVVQDINLVKEIAEKIRRTKVLYYDTEATGLRVRVAGNDYATGYTFAFDDEVDKNVYYIPVGHDVEGVYKSNGQHLLDFLKLYARDFPDFLKWESELDGKEYYNLDIDEVNSYIIPAMENTDAILVAHNQMYDWHVLANNGCNVEKMIKRLNYDDTQLAFHTRYEEELKKLEEIVQNVFKIRKADYDDIVATVPKEVKVAAGLKANNKATFNLVAIPLAAQYSGEDVYFMKVLYYDLLDEVKEDGMYKLYRELRIPFMRVLWKMERAGVKFDIESAKKMSVAAEKELETLKYQLFELVGAEFNPSSGQQLYELLFGFKKKLKDKNTGEYKESYNKHLVALSYKFPFTKMSKNEDKKLQVPSTDAEVMEELLLTENPTPRQKEGLKLVKMILRYKGLEKLKGTFIDGMIDQMYQDGRIHPSLNICGTTSWRISCSEPNLQNLTRPLEKPKVPRREDFETEEGYLFSMGLYKEEKDEYDFWHRFEVRSLFVPSDKSLYISSHDYNNLEARISTCASEDPNMLRLFRENLDGHGLVTTLIFEECKDLHPNEVKKKFPELRQKGKTIRFALDYGGTAYALSRQLKQSREECQKYIDKYFEGFSGITRWQIKQKKDAHRDGYVTTFSGHKRHLPGIYSSNPKVSYKCERLACNAPIQGFASEVVARAQIAIDNDSILRLLGCTMMLQVHDEVVCEFPKKYASICSERLKYIMENSAGVDLILPLPVAGGYSENNYLEAK